MKKWMFFMTNTSNFIIDVKAKIINKRSYIWSKIKIICLIIKEVIKGEQYLCYSVNALYTNRNKMFILKNWLENIGFSVSKIIFDRYNHHHMIVYWYGRK